MQQKVGTKRVPVRRIAKDIRTPIKKPQVGLSPTVDAGINIMEQLFDINSSVWDLANRAIKKRDTATALACLREIRGQLDSYVGWQKTYYEAKDIQRFQAVVLEVIDIYAPELRDKILTELARRRALSSIS